MLNVLKETRRTRLMWFTKHLQKQVFRIAAVRNACSSYSKACKSHVYVQKCFQKHHSGSTVSCFSALKGQYAFDSKLHHRKKKELQETKNGKKANVNNQQVTEKDQGSDTWLVFIGLAFLRTHLTTLLWL